MDIGKKIKKYREIHGITQTDFGKIVGANKQTVSKWEKGILQPSTSKIYEIASTLGISVQDILKDENLEEKPIYKHKARLDVGINALYIRVHDFDSFYSFIDAMYVGHKILEPNSQFMGFLLPNMTYEDKRSHDEAFPINQIYCVEKNIVIDIPEITLGLNEENILNIEQESTFNNELYGFNVYLKENAFIQLILGITANA